MFLTPWGAAGRQNQLSFFDEFGCTILAPGKKIIIVKVHFQAVTVRPGGPEFSPGAMWYMVRDHDGYGDKKNPSTFVLVFKKIDSGVIQGRWLDGVTGFQGDRVAGLQGDWVIG